MKGINIDFKNRPNEDGTVSSFTVKDCLVAQSGSPTVNRPQLTVHLPKTDSTDVTDAWFDYDGGTYHVVGTAAKSIADNTPTRWDRYTIAEKMY